jgi:hypothetical protein
MTKMEKLRLFTRPSILGQEELEISLSWTHSSMIPTFHGSMGLVKDPEFPQQIEAFEEG